MAVTAQRPVKGRFDEAAVEYLLAAAQEIPLKQPLAIVVTNSKSCSTTGGR